MWSAKALIRHKTMRKSHIVYVDIIAQRPKNFRLEVTASLGVHLASLARKDHQLTYLLTRQKHYRKIRSHGGVFKDILGIAIHPNVLMAAFFDQEVRQPGWTCIKDKNGFLLKCSDEEVVLSWKKRYRDRRTILFENNTHQVQMLLKGFKGNVDINPNIFSIKKPDGFS